MSMILAWFVVGMAVGVLVWPAIYAGSWVVAWVRYRHRCLKCVALQLDWCMVMEQQHSGQQGWKQKPRRTHRDPGPARQQSPPSRTVDALIPRTVAHPPA